MRYDYESDDMLRICHQQKLAGMYKQLTHCNCGNWEQKEKISTCSFCGKTMCSLCQGRHGEKHYHNDTNPANICFRDELITVRTGGFVAVIGIPIAGLKKVYPKKVYIENKNNGHVEKIRDFLE